MITAALYALLATLTALAALCVAYVAVVVWCIGMAIYETWRHGRNERAM